MFSTKNTRDKVIRVWIDFLGGKERRREELNLVILNKVGFCPKVGKIGEKGCLDIMNLFV